MQPKFNNKQKKFDNNNFFARNIQAYGTDFLNVINTDQLQRESIRLVKDITAGKIDITKYSVYLTDPRLLTVILPEIQIRWVEAFEVQKALSYYIAGMQASNQPLQDSTLKTLDKYSTLNTILEKIFGAFSQVQVTGNVMFLSDLMNYNIKNNRHLIY